jgi:hypothetical protein
MQQGPAVIGPTLALSAPKAHSIIALLDLDDFRTNMKYRKQKSCRDRREVRNALVKGLSSPKPSQHR